MRVSSLLVLVAAMALVCAPAFAMNRDAVAERDAAATEAEGLNEAEAEIDAFIAAESETEAEGEAEAETEDAVDADVAAAVATESETEAEADAEAEAEVAAGANCMSVEGLNMIKSFEGFYPKMYKDVAGIPTIGYGTLCSDNLIKCPGPVTEATAASVLSADLIKHYGPCVANSVKASLNNNQYSALVSFAYNAGCGALAAVAKNNKLDAASGANYAGVGPNMLKYNKAHVKGVLQVVAGLTRRRTAEAALFNSKNTATCMNAAPAATTVLKAAAPTPNAAFAPCVAIGGVCSTTACAGTLVHNKCGSGAPVCCVPKAAAPSVPAPAPVTPAPAPAAATNCMSQAGVDMVKSFEGFYSKEYKDVAGIPTIGYGTLCTDGLIKCPGPVSEPVAAAILGADLVKKYSGCVRTTVKAPLNNNQFSALVSFAYNAGCGAMQNVATYAGLTKTTGANYAVVPSRMALYNKARVKGVLTVVKGLVRRRAAEGALFASSAASTCMTVPSGTVLKSGAPSTGAAATPAVGGMGAAALAREQKHRRHHGRHSRHVGRHHRRHHRRQHYDARDLFNLRRDEVDLPSGSVVQLPGVPNATHKRIIARADIAGDVKSHDHKRRHRGPLGTWSKHAQHTARKQKVPIQN